MTLSLVSSFEVKKILVCLIFYEMELKHELNVLMLLRILNLMKWNLLELRVLLLV